MSDVSSIAICACVGCGRTSETVQLKKLSTYSRSFSCFDCFMKHSACGGCHHPMHAKKSGDPDQCYCGCTSYRHGLEQEWDRQLAEVAGKKPDVHYCQGLAGKFCGTVVLRKVDGSLPRLCSRHEREWTKDVIATLKGRDRAMREEMI